MPAIASLSLTSQPGTLEQALTWLGAVARRQQWPPRLAHILMLTLDEALSNILMHGFPSPVHAEGAAIDLVILTQNDSIVLEIQDNGIPFDPTGAQPPEPASSLDDATMGGHGLRLMHHLLQDIQYERRQQTNCLRLIARHPGTAWPDVDSGPAPQDGPRS